MVVTGRQVLSEADRVINGERQNQYGEAEDSFDIIAKKWSATLEGIFRTKVELTREDVALMMIDLKTARQICGEGKLDNYIDICGYAALAGAMFSKGKEQSK